jgi:hypothetical protein
MWEWVDSIERGESAPSFLGIWPRGGGKSTGAEVAAVELGARGRRRYAWYVRETQDQADKSVANINGILETPEVARCYPDMAERAVSKYGKPKAWRRERLTTASGFTIDGAGLDKAIRGVKDVEQRPDLIIIDDIDSRHDSPATTSKKIQTITDSIIPAGSPDVVVLFIQNLIIPDGVMAQLADGRADFLLERIVSGPHPAAHNLAYEQREGRFVVTGGEPTWPEGYGLEVIQDKINKSGLTSFLRESQHDVEKTGGMYDHIDFQYCDWSELPRFERGSVWVDPAVTSTDQSDSMGIQADGVDSRGHLYRLYSWEAVTSPEDALRRAIEKAVELGFETVGVETDQGGDTWRSVYERALEGLRAEEKHKDTRYWPAFEQNKAGAGYGSKVERGQRMLAAYERGEITHVRGTHGVLERSLRRFPNKPLDLADAAFWSWEDLCGGHGGPVSIENPFYD